MKSKALRIIIILELITILLGTIGGLIGFIGTMIDESNVSVDGDVYNNSFETLYAIAGSLVAPSMFVYLILSAVLFTLTLIAKDRAEYRLPLFSAIWNFVMGFYPLVLYFMVLTLIFNDNFLSFFVVYAVITLTLYTVGFVSLVKYFLLLRKIAKNEISGKNNNIGVNTASYVNDEKPFYIPPQKETIQKPIEPKKKEDVVDHELLEKQLEALSDQYNEGKIEQKEFEKQRAKIMAKM